MGETMDSENAAFWLPTHFLTDDDFLSDDRTFKKVDDYANSFSLDSPVSSTETELGDSHPDDSNNLNDDDDEFLAELTRHLAQSTLQDSPPEKPWVFSTSPQSTLSGFGPWTNRSGFSSNGSPNGPSSQVPSPPVTPPAKNDASWELLYEAAGQVARLKMHALAAQMNHHHHNHNSNSNNHHHGNRGLLSAPRNVSLPSKSHHHHHNHNSFYDFPQYEQVKRQGNYYCQHHHNNQQQRRSCGGGGGPLGLPNSAWPPLRQNHHHHRQPNGCGPGMRALFLNGPGSGPMAGIKRQSTGTGVFIPKRGGVSAAAPPPEPRKKSTVILPARVVHALNLDLEEMNNGVGVGVNATSHSRFGSGLLSDHEIYMARRNAIMEQQRRNMMRSSEKSAAAAAASMVGGHEIRLPSDWTY